MGNDSSAGSVPSTDDRTIWFDPSSGWCWVDGGPVMRLLNPARGTKMTLRDSLAEILRRVLQRGRESSFLQEIDDLSIPGWSSMLQALPSAHRLTRESLPTLLGLASPTQLWIEVQGGCNERCIHCYAGSEPADLPALGPAKVKAVLDDAAEIGFDLVQFTGGDPLLWNRLPGMARHARGRGLEPEIYTNGLALSQSLYDELLPAEPRFAFSFYSHDPETHDRVTQVDGSWKRTVSAMKRALEGPTPVRVGMVVLPPNREHVPRTRAFLEDLGVAPDRIRVTRSLSVGRGAQVDSPAPWDTSAHGDRSLSEGADGGSHASMGASAFNPGKLCVSYEGDVIPCIFQRGVRLGSILRREFRAIVREPHLERTDAFVDDAGSEDRLSCAECRFHDWVLTSLVREAEGTSGDTREPTGIPQ